MNNYGPGFGREKSVEDLADEIMNQPGEGLDDLMESVEIDDDASFEDIGGGAFSDSYDESDDGGDYSEL